MAALNPNRRHQNPVLPAYRRVQLQYLRRVALHELDEHHVHVVEDQFAECRAVDVLTHQAERLQPGDQCADLFGQRVVEAGLSLAERAIRPVASRSAKTGQASCYPAASSMTAR
jgi:hypothetical protein